MSENGNAGEDSCSMVELSAFSPELLFCGEDGRLGNWPLDLVHGPKEPDPVAVFSTLQYGAPVPPLSPWRGVNRVLPGFTYKNGRSRPMALALPKRVQDLDGRTECALVDGELDAILREAIGDGPDPIVLFSGGVDSGIIAGRLAALGRRDTILVNYALSSDDPESLHAEAMAKELNLRFERYVRTEPATKCLENPGKIYPQPFTDRSTGPTAELASHVVARWADSGRPIIDGTGADGAFGLILAVARWKRIKRMPFPIQRLLASWYTSLWYRKSKLERIARVMRFATALSVPELIVARNPLSGILYRDEAGPDVALKLAEWVRPWAGDDDAHRAICADLALICANVFAQKAHPIYTGAGFDVTYPFLDLRLVKLGLAACGQWGMHASKYLLKRSLVKMVPPGMVYRPKAGFVDPDWSVLESGTFIEHLRAAAEPTSPISSVVIPGATLKACGLLARGQRLPSQAEACLWGMAFVDRWYRTASVKGLAAEDGKPV